MKIKILSLFLIFSFFILIGCITTFQSRHQQYEKQIENKSLKGQNNFIESIEDHYKNLVTLFNNSEIELASKQLDLFRLHNKLDYKDITEYDKKITIYFLEEKVKPIPVYKAHENLEIYEQLLKLDPENPKYKKKVAFYKAKIEEKKDKDIIKQDQIAWTKFEVGKKYILSKDVWGLAAYHGDACRIINDLVQIFYDTKSINSYMAMVNLINQRGILKKFISGSKIWVVSINDTSGYIRIASLTYQDMPLCWSTETWLNGQIHPTVPDFVVRELAR